MGHFSHLNGFQRATKHNAPIVDEAAERWNSLG